MRCALPGRRSATRTSRLSHARPPARACLLAQARITLHSRKRPASSCAVRARVGSALWKQKQNLDLRKGVAEQLVVLDYSLPRTEASVATGCRAVASASTRDPAAAAVARSLQGGKRPDLCTVEHKDSALALVVDHVVAHLRSRAVHRLRVTDRSGFRDLAQIEMGSGESVPSGNERFHEFATVANSRQGRVRAWATHAAHPNEIWMPARALS